MVKFNLPWIAKVVSRFVKYYNCEYLFEDLLGYAISESLEIAEKFDWRKGFKFSTYVSNALFKNLLKDFLETGNTIKISPYAYKKGRDYLLKENEIAVRLSHRPNSEEVDQNIGISLRKRRLVFKALAAQKPVYFSRAKAKKVEDDEYNPLEPRFQEDPSRGMDMDYIKERLNVAMNDLSGIERLVILFRYGFYDLELKYGEIANILRIEKSSVRNIVRRSIKKLREGLERRGFEASFLSD